MNNLMKRENNSLQHTFGSVLDNFFRRDIDQLFNDDYWGFKGLNTQMNVPVNIHETEHGYELEMNAPGMKKEDFSIDLNGRSLVISAAKKEGQKQEEPNYIRQEFSRRSFSRSFQLDDSIDAANIQAAYENGILKLSLPKKEEAKKISRTIEIG